MRRATKIAAAAVAVLVVAGGAFWLVRASRTPAKPDCSIAADMMAYRKTTGLEISAVTYDQNIDDPQKVILEKYDAWLTETQKDTDSIKDPNIRQRAQAVVDADKGFMDNHRSRIEHPIDLDDPGARKDFENKTMAAVNRQSETAKALQQVCPDVATYN